MAPTYGLDKVSQTPPRRVFVSYTGEDLDGYADVVADVVRKLEWICVDHRDWGAVGTPSVAECRAGVHGCDILVVLVAHRYGWVPPVDQGGDGTTSITWLEVRWAREAGLRVLPYLVDPEHAWPPDHIEGLGDEAALERLDRFKAELRESICGFFTTPASLEGRLALDLPRAGEETVDEAAAVGREEVDREQGPRHGSAEVSISRPRERAASLALPDYQYRPVKIRFERAADATYALDAESAGAQVHAQPCSLDPEELTSLLWAAAAKPDGVLRRAQLEVGDEGAGLLPSAADVKRLGERLHSSLFSSDLGPWLAANLGSVNRQERRGLRFVIDTTHSPELAELPWEFLYDPAREDFLFSDDMKPVVRWLQVDQPTPSLAVAPPLRLLVAIAAPRDRPDLAIGSELTHLARELQELEVEGLITVHLLHETTLNRLDEALTREAPHILHFVGHGDFVSDEGVVIFEAGETRSSRPISGRRLAVALRPHLAYLRLVFLNSCLGATASRRDPFGGVAQGLIRRGVPAVIAMQFPIRDKAAVVLARQFYRYVAAGRPIDAALTAARAFLFAESDVEWGSPALHMQTADGRLFQVAVAGDVPQPPVVTVEPHGAGHPTGAGSAAPGLPAQEEAAHPDVAPAATQELPTAPTASPEPRTGLSRSASRLLAIAALVLIALLGPMMFRSGPEDGPQSGGGDGQGNGGVPAQVRISGPSPAAIGIGTSVALDAEVRNEDGVPMSDIAPAWASDDPGVATVSSDGLVTAVGAGTARIVVTAGDAETVYSITVLENDTGGGGPDPDPGDPGASIVQYQVRAGDHLWRIAGNLYGDPRLWPLIYDANRDRISDPDLIFPDQSLVIPRGLSTAEQQRRLRQLWSELR